MENGRPSGGAWRRRNGMRRQFGLRGNQEAGESDERAVPLNLLPRMIHVAMCVPASRVFWLLILIAALERTDWRVCGAAARGHQSGSIAVARDCFGECLHQQSPRARFRGGSATEQCSAWAPPKAIRELNNG